MKAYKYYVYSETKFANRKRAGIRIVDYHASIDWTPVVFVILAVVSAFALMIAGGVI